ncbi:hypothetical protein ACSNOI_10595 [Actinomadura kijaniata]|uniref:hypothetical protein n=1 Tax=Actinomadura kijaniata TaxID=46161 RepID=UPI003F1DF710
MAPNRTDLPGRVGYALVALPAGVVSLAGGRAQVRLARRLLGVEAHGAARGRVAAHAAASLPLGLLSTVVTGYGWLVVALNLLYPLRPLVGMGDGSYEDAWGGPTLAGAWAVHAAGGVGVAVVTVLLALGFARLQERQARRALRAERMG